MYPMYIYMCVVIELYYSYCKPGMHFKGAERGHLPPKNKMAPWAMLCVLLLILFLKDS